MDNTSWYRISYDVTLKDETTVKIYRTVFETSNYSLSEESVDWCRQAMGIKKMQKGKRMDDLISRQAAIDAFWKTEVEFRPSQIDEVMRILEQLPSIQPQTTTITIGRTKEGVTMWYECDHCGEPIDFKDNYCRNCGRRLLKDE